MITIQPQGGRLAANGYDEHPPGQYSLLSALVTEVVLTMMFLFIFIVMGSTHGRAPADFASIALSESPQHR